MAIWTSFAEYNWYTTNSQWAGDGLGTWDQANSSASRFIFLNSDGTKTYLNGSNLLHGGTGLTSWQSLSSVEHIGTDGTTVLERITGIDPNIKGENGHIFSDATIGILKDADTLTGSAGRDHIYGQGGANVFFAGAGADSVGGGSGPDTFRIEAGDWVDRTLINGVLVGDTIDGGGGTDTLQLENAGNINLSFQAVASVEVANFFSGNSTITIAEDSLGAFQTFVGGAGVDGLVITGAGSAGGNLSGLTFTSWTAGQDTITIVSGGGNFGHIIGTNQNDKMILSGHGNVDGGAGDDTFIYDATSSGGDIAGGLGTDSIQLDLANIDFGRALITGVERLVFNSGVSTVSFTATVGEEGIAEIFGSANTDTIIVSGGSGGQTLDFSEVSFTSWTNGIDSITINGGLTATLIGTSQSDHINGSIGSDTLIGGDGNDVLNGDAGADVLSGGNGNDTLLSDDGDTSIDGGTGVDSLQANGNQSATVITSVENLLLGNGAQVTLTAAQLNTFVSVDYNGPQSGAGFVFTLVTAGSIGANFVAATPYGSIIGSAGADTIDVSQSTNGHGWILSAGDNIGGNILTSGSGNDTLNAGNGGDTLNGNAGDDTLNGGNGADTLNGGVGNDTINGGGGIDVAVFAGARAAYTITGSGATFQISGSDGTDTLADVERAMFDDGTVVLIDQPPVIASDGGGDTAILTVAEETYAVTAVAANDPDPGATLFFSIVGGADQALFGIDAASGALGFITAPTFAVPADADHNNSYIVQVRASDGTLFDTQTLTVNVTSASNVINGDSGDNSLNGTAQNDVIHGLDGNDTIFAGAGQDTVTGDDGNDTLVGNADVFASEPDTLSGGNGNDTILGEPSDTINGGAGIDTLQAVNSNPWTIDLGATSIEFMLAGFGDDHIDASTQTTGVTVFAGGGDNTVIGSAFDDNLWGGVGNDALTGGDGNDLLFGELGADSLTGGNGNDTIYADSNDTHIDGGAGTDALYWAAGVNANIDLAADSIEFVQTLGDNDTLTAASTSTPVVIFAGAGDDTITGGSGADFLWGEDGNDIIVGGAGNDTLVGGAGSDRLTGGAGTDNIYGNNGTGGDGVADTYVFDTPAWGTDFVYDFDNGSDKFDLHGSGAANFAALTVTDTGPHAQIAFNGNLIVVVNAAGQIDVGDFLF